MLEIKNSWTFPFFAFDFYTAEITAAGMNPLTRAIILSPGRQSIRIWVSKGPTGHFGNSTLFGICRSDITLEARAGSKYVASFVRNKEADAIQVLDEATGFVLDYAVCVQSKSWLHPNAPP